MRGQERKEKKNEEEEGKKKWGGHEEISMFCNLHSYTLPCRLLVISIYKKYRGWMDLLPPSHIKHLVWASIFFVQDTQSRRNTSANSHSPSTQDIHTADRAGVLCL